jgi:hypothetical protein
MSCLSASLLASQRIGWTRYNHYLLVFAEEATDQRPHEAITRDCFWYYERLYTVSFIRPTGELTCFEDDLKITFARGFSIFYFHE